MKRKIVAALLTATFAQAGGAEPPSNLYGLVWNDDFSGTAIDVTKWTFRTDSKKLSTQLPANVEVRDNRLSLMMKKEAANGKAYTGGGVITRRLFGYGYYEVTARTTSNVGWHNSFWMMAGDGSDTYGPGHYLEIDQFEINTKNPSTVTSGLIFWDGKVGPKPIKMDRCPDLNSFNSSAGYHTYGADWREGAVDLYVDGKKYCTRAYPIDTYRQDPVRIWLTAIAYEAPVTVGGTPQLYRNARFYQRDAYVLAGHEGYTESGAGWQGKPKGGFGLMPQRRSCTAGAAARFVPNVAQAGRYRVSLWNDARPDRGGTAEVTLTSADGTERRRINLAKAGKGWVDLGVHSFAKDQTASVTARGDAGCLSASAAKFVRIEG